jgi:hypothetical protein
MEIYIKDNLKMVTCMIQNVSIYIVMVLHILGKLIIINWKDIVKLLIIRNQLLVN